MEFSISRVNFSSCREYIRSFDLEVYPSGKNRPGSGMIFAALICQNFSKADLNNVGVSNLNPMGKTIASLCRTQANRHRICLFSPASFSAQAEHFLTIPNPTVNPKIVS